MATTENGYGMIPKYSLGGLIRPRAYLSGILSGYNTALYKYQPVALNSSGNIVAATTAADFIGVFAGWEGMDSTGKWWTINQWSANQTYAATEEMYAYIWDDPNIVYRIQCDATLAQSNGGQVDLSSNIGNGNATTGLASCTANAGSLTTSGQKQLRIIELAPNYNTVLGGNAWGDAFPDIDVQIARHQYVSNKVAV